MVSRSYVEVCLPSSYDSAVANTDKLKEKSPSDDDEDVHDTSADLFDELRSGDLPRIVRKLHKELDGIKADFMAFSENISGSASEMRDKSQSCLADVFVSK